MSTTGDSTPPVSDSAAAGDQSTSGCTGGETPFEGACYLAVGYQWLDSTTAEQLCSENNAQMTSIHSEAENQMIYGLLPHLSGGAFIGLRRNGTGFDWQDGTPLDYLNWGANEPNNFDGKEDCGVMWGPGVSDASLRGQWNDSPCDANRDTVVCKRIPN